ncbi:hypothetical protein NQ314_009083 [Rhamnusium bicolor]|uniref:Peptidase S1 domain-containing protein n=1 Tax=Rhamnusium bicolor TaxID=1586634 RepID=A0AAV8Y2N1_9CUCU|nr:hypothetical protein NQ314_009083 [Rhamnusium bicolor]
MSLSAFWRTTPNLGSPDGRIVGGGNALRGQYPYQVSVHYCIRPDTCQHACGGVIINAFWVLSAGHCITDAPAPGVGPHDLSLFRVATRFEFSYTVLVAPLPSVDEQIVGDVSVTGWGSIGGSSDNPIMPSSLQFAAVPYLNGTACKAALDIVLNGAPTPLDLDTNVCTGSYIGGTSICTGDSGGPLTYLSRELTIEVIGITSWGLIPCGTAGAPSVYVKLFPYLDWIMDNVSS